MHKLIQAFNSYKHLFYYSIISFLVFFIFRLIGIFVYYKDLILSEIPMMLFQGLRIDIVTLGYLLSVPTVLVFLMQFAGDYLRRILSTCEKLYLTFSGSLLFFLELCTFPFIEEYGQRPNRIFIEYLIYPNEVIKLMVNNNNHLLVSIAFIFIMIGVIWFLWKIINKLIFIPKQTSFLSAIISFLFIGCLVFICGRSSFQHRPFNLAKAYFSTNQLVNVLTGNSIFSLVTSVKAAYGEKKVSYPSQKYDVILNNIKNDTNFDYTVANDTHPLLNHLKPTATFNKTNVVIILEESFGAQFVKSLGGKDLAPNIDKLCEKYWCFTNMYATGVRSIRGIEAVTTGFTPTVNRAVVKRELSQRNFFNLATAFKQHGYENLFIYGGESNFDNMRSFFLGNNYTRIIDYSDYQDPSFVATWGVSDEDLFAKSIDELDRLAENNKPFYALIFTSSNHDPFEIPDNKIDIGPLSGDVKRYAAVKYADYSLGKFVEAVKAKAYFDNTIFLVIADHDARVTGKNMVPIEHFHIPAVIFGNKIGNKIEKHVVSQIDMPKTILSLAGIEIDTPMIGYDLSNIPSDFNGRAMMQYYDNFVLMRDDRTVALVQPEKKVITMKYQDDIKSLERIKNNNDYNSLALSYALIGELSYKKQFYNNLTKDK